MVFLADEDYQFYLENLKEWKIKLGIKLYACCLMTNHIHLIVGPGDGASTVSELMKRLAGRQDAFVNNGDRFLVVRTMKDLALVCFYSTLALNTISLNLLVGIQPMYNLAPVFMVLFAGF